MRRSLFILIALGAMLVAAPAAFAQGPPSALVYNDGTAALQTAYSAFTDELTLQGSSVEATSDAAYFGAQLATGAHGVYGAFGSDGVLLDSWLAQTPTNAHFLKVTLAPDGDLDTEYVSFSSPTAAATASGGRRVVASTRSGSLQVLEVEDFATNTADGQPAPKPATATAGATAAPALAARATAQGLGWPWDGIVEAITDFFSDWFDDILEWLQNVGECAADCVDTFLDNIPEGVEIEVTVEVQTTPPGVTTSISVKASGAAAVQLMRAYASMIECIGGCVANA